MMNVVIAGGYAVALESIASMHFEGEKLMVHLSGGRWLTLMGPSADQLWTAYTVGAVNLKTGEVLSA